MLMNYSNHHFCTRIQYLYSNIYHSGHHIPISHSILYPNSRVASQHFCQILFPWVICFRALTIQWDHAYIKVYETNKSKPGVTYTVGFQFKYSDFRLKLSNASFHQSKRKKKKKKEKKIGIASFRNQPVIRPNQSWILINCTNKVGQNKMSSQRNSKCFATILLQAFSSNTSFPCTE